MSYMLTENVRMSLAAVLTLILIWTVFGSRKCGCKNKRDEDLLEPFGALRVRPRGANFKPEEEDDPYYYYTQNVRQGERKYADNNVMDIATDVSNPDVVALNRDYRRQISNHEVHPAGLGEIVLPKTVCNAQGVTWDVHLPPSMMGNYGTIMCTDQGNNYNCQILSSDMYAGEREDPSWNALRYSNLRNEELMELGKIINEIQHVNSGF